MRAPRARAAPRRAAATRCAPMPMALGIAELHRLLPGDLVLGEPEPDAQARRSAHPRRLLELALLHLPDRRQDLLARRDELRRGLDRPRVGAEAALGEGQPELAQDAPGPRRHHHHPLAEEERLLDRVGDEDDGLAELPPEPQNQPLHLLARQRVERPERLVHQDHLGLVGEAARERHPLLHAARELVDRPVGEPVEADGLQELRHLRRRLRARPARHPRPEARRCRRPSATRRARPAGRPCPARGRGR